MSNLCEQDTCSSFTTTCNGVTMTFFNVGHGCDWTHKPESFKQSSVHFCGYQLFHEMVEAASYVSVTKSVMTRFIKREIICRYGLPKRIISDNALNLNNDMMTEVCT